ncbi:MAG: xanthine dehydrogenase family protein molybdopterin-binding subunit [Elusimicrobiota bacterium]
MPVVGTSARRKDGRDKLCGAAKYVDDYAPADCLFGVTYRSTVPHALIVNIHFDPKFPWNEYVMTTAEEIPGKNVVTLIEDDQPLLAHKKVMHAQEPIVLLAHRSRERAYEALNHIKVEYRELPAVLTMEDALKKKQVIFGMDNVFKRITITKGSVKKGFRSARRIISGEYRVPHQEQAYIENQGIISYVDKNGTLVVMGSMQCPYYIVKALGPVFGLPEERIRVIQTTTGGGFGGKEEYPNILAGHAALLAFKAKRPVKMIYDRREDMLATTKRHPAIVRHRTGLDKNGRLAAMEIDIVMDGGAYCTLSPVVLSRGILHATGPYECPNVNIVARSVATNTPPNGAFRGFGAPQTLFPLELHMEKIAAALKVDSLTLRRRNVVKIGSSLSTGQVLKESVGASEVLERTAARSGYAKKRKAYAKHNRNKKNPAWKGIGLALIHHGAGFTGNGERFLASKAAVALTRGGGVRVDTASSEMGQGSLSTLAQIAADAVGVPYDWIETAVPDTHRVPDSGPTVASRTCMIVGGLIRRAALQLRDAVSREMGGFPSDREGLAAAAKKLCDDKSERLFTVQYEKPEEINFDDVKYRGDAYGSYGYACAVVDLEVDRLSYEITVRKVWTASDIGKAINPKIVEGQIMGGTAQALGWALLENAVYERGVMQNPLLTNYIIPTSMDTPEMEVEIVELPYSRGPFGAKGIGEMPMDAPAPAAASAVQQATGLWIPELPILPEKIARELHD